MNDLTSLLTGENAVLVAAIVAVVSTARASFKAFFVNRIGKRLLPIMPMLLGVAATLSGFGSVKGSDGGWQDCVVLGLVAGFTAGQLFKAGKTSIFGWGLPDQPAPDPEAGSSE